MQYLLEHPIIIFAIIGLISPFLKKKKTDNQEQSKELVLKKRENIPQTSNEVRPEAIRLPRELKPRKTKLAQEYKEIKPVIEISQTEQIIKGKKESFIHREKSENVDRVKGESDKSIDLSPSKENVIDGIVWAEILGPPRALKSHQIRRPTPRR